MARRSATRGAVPVSREVHEGCAPGCARARGRRGKRDGGGGCESGDEPGRHASEIPLRRRRRRCAPRFGEKRCAPRRVGRPERRHTCVCRKRKKPATGISRKRNVTVSPPRSVHCTSSARVVNPSRTARPPRRRSPRPRRPRLRATRTPTRFSRVARTRRAPPVPARRAPRRLGPRTGCPPRRRRTPRAALGWTGGPEGWGG